MCPDAVPRPVRRAWARAARTPLPLALILVLLATTGCEKRNEEPAGAQAKTKTTVARGDGPRLVVLYATCSLSRAHLGPYSPGVSYTPNLSRFAEQALVFDRHQAEAGQSGTAFASIVTGTGAASHGILRHPYYLDQSLYTITEAFADGGYDVHTWLDHLMASTALRYGQGVPAENAHAGMLRADSPEFVAILDRLASDPSYKAFVMTTFTVTHSPYSGEGLDAFCASHPGECEIRRDAEAFERDRAILQENFLHLAVNHPDTVARLRLGPADVAHFARSMELLYKVGVNRLDTMFGALVAAIDAKGLEKQSLIAFTSDHGEILYRDDALLFWTHGFQLSPEELNVALLIRGPGIQPGRYAVVTRSIDDFPTLASLAGLRIELPEEAGTDLSGAMTRGEDPPRLLAYSHSSLFPGKIEDYPFLVRMLNQNRPADLWVSVRDGDRVFKLRRFGGDAPFQPVMFDLASDPTERVDLFDQSNPEHREMLVRLEDYKRRLVEGNARMQAKRMDEERAQRALKQLGYVQ